MDSHKHWTLENLDLVIEACSQPDLPVPHFPPQVPSSSSSQKHNLNSNKVFPTQQQQSASATNSPSLFPFSPDFVFPFPSLGEMKNGRDALSSPEANSNLGSPTFEFPITTTINNDRQIHMSGSMHRGAQNGTHVFQDVTVFDLPVDAARSSPGNEQVGTEGESFSRYLYILNHASNCFERRCSLKECHKMRAFIAHANRCPNSGKGCHLCRRFLMLSRVHASQCDKPIGHCPVLLCAHFKLEKIS